MAMKYVASISIFVCIILATLDSVCTSRITFQAGSYNDIVVGIHPSMDDTLCPSIISNIRELFLEAGSQLFRASNERATFGSINLLLPPSWNERKCLLTTADITPAKAYQTYEVADFKLTSTQPMATSLPWAKQFQNCGTESDSIYIPLQFLLSSSIFDPELKGRLLTHEWTKYRYGVFEEFGYFDDLIFSPCYTRGGRHYYTSCTNNKMNAIGTSGGQLSPENCRSLIAQSSAYLLEQMRSATSSLISAPNFSNVHNFCSELTHNGLTPTRQNVFCERKSIAAVINNHPDFKSKASVIPSRTDPVPRSRSLQVNIIKQSPDPMNPGFAFIIEDTPNIRIEGRLDHVKQGIATMLRMANDQTDVTLLRFNGGINCGIAFNCVSRRLSEEYIRTHFLGFIPDSTTAPAILTGNGKSETQESRQTRLDQLLRDVLAQLAPNIKWNLILVTSMPPVNLPQAITAMSNSEYSLSVLTFDGSEDWIKFNSIPNTLQMLFLPHCFKDNHVCHGKTSSLVADYLLKMVTKTSPLDYRRYFHKVVDENINALSGAFNLSNVVPGGTNFVLHLPVYDDAIVFAIQPPVDQACTGSAMLEYRGVLDARTCSLNYRSGEWRYTLQGHNSSFPVSYNLRGYVVTFKSVNDFAISSQFGHKLDTKVFPSLTRLPVYISIMSKEDQPIIGASVELVMDYEGDSFARQNLTILKDNGLDPDLTADDGVYSAFLTTFKAVPAYHSPQVRITTTSESCAIKSIQLDKYEAALLDDRMVSKCCGSRVHAQEVIDIPYSTYTQVLSSFRTGEEVDPSRDFIPPSKIYSAINQIEDSGNYLAYQFTAPGANNYDGRVSHYDICCTAEESGNLDDTMCRRVLIEHCDPVDPNTNQTCGMYSSNLIVDFLGGAVQEVILFCAFRGVNNAGTNGPMSSFLVDIDISAYPATSSCRSISDDCLPIGWFWGLIACIGGLLLLLVVILIVWCCRAYKKKTKAPNANRQLPKDSTKRDSMSSLRNVYINQAYIQDSNGQLRLVASDGEFLPATSNEARSNINRRPVTDNFPPISHQRNISVHEISPSPMPISQIQNQNLTHNIAQNSPSKQVTWNTENLNVEPITFPERTPTENSETSSRPPAFEPPAIPRNTQYPNNANSTPQFLGQEDREYPTPPRWENTPSPPPMTINRTGNGPPLKVSNKELPIYASVQRFSRRPNPSTMEPLNSSIPINQPSPTRGTGQFSPVFSEAPTTFASKSQDKSNLRPKSSPQRSNTESSPRPRPPVQMDHFPSSESEAYSDMSHILPRLAVVMNKPPILPPIPTTAPSRKDERQIPPKPMARTPSKDVLDNGTEIGGPNSYPPVPVPPPPRQFRNSPNPVENDDSDDSDNWDNYDEFEFSPPGTSFA